MTDCALLRDHGLPRRTRRIGLSDFCKFWRYDAAFIYFWTRGALGAAVARMFGKKVIFTGGVR